MDEIIHVAFILDENYIMPASTSIFSLIKNKADDTKLVVHLIMDDVEASLAERFKCFEKEKISIDIISTSAEIFRGLHKYNSKSYCVASIAALLKFSLPHLLASLDKVIYLDGDLIVRHDLKELWDTELGDCYVAAAIDSGTMYSKNPFHKMVQGYFNSGVMLLNLSKMRTDSCTEKLLATKKRQKDSNLMDQNIFNLVFDGHIRYISLLHNFLYVNLVRAKEKYSIEQLNSLYGTNFSSLDEVYQSASILHFSSKDKPWKYADVPGGDEWRSAFSEMMHEYPELLYLGSGIAKDKVGRRKSVSLAGGESLMPFGMDERMPLITVVMTLSHRDGSLEKSLTALRRQSWKSYEVLIITDEATEEERLIIRKYSSIDDRFLILKEGGVCSENAKYKGMCAARGEYVLYMASNCIASGSLLKKLYMQAEMTQADIVAAHYYEVDAEGIKRSRNGFHLNWLEDVEENGVFDYHDCPDRIMSMFPAVPGARLYRKDFLLQEELRLREKSMNDDMVFSAITAIMADRISCLKENLLEYYCLEKKISAQKTVAQITNAINYAMDTSCCDDIKNSICRFAIENYMEVLWNHIRNFRQNNGAGAERVREYYKYLHNLFGSKMYADLDEEKLHSENLYRDLCIVRSMDCEQIEALAKHELIVSMTSFPARIDCVPVVVASLIKQTISADRIELWLSRDEFPEADESFSEQLKEYQEKGIIDICWCEGNLKPHKKYYYAMRQHPDAVIVTVDDDLTCPREMLRSLYRSYFEFPYAVSAMRTHFIMMDDEKERILPYQRWLHEQEVILGVPTHALLATGGAGGLYPPHVLNVPDMFEESIIESVAPHADDLWLKAMEILSGVKVVQADIFRELSYVDGSQEIALWRTNVKEDGNDEQLKEIIDYVAESRGNDVITSVLGEAWESLPAPRMEVIMDYFKNKKDWLWSKIRNARRDGALQLNVKLRKAYKEKSELSAKLKKTYAEKSEINAKLKQTYAEKSEINAKLKQTYAEKSEINAKLQRTYQEKAERGIEIKNLRARLDIYEPWRQGKEYQADTMVTVLEKSPATILVGSGEFGMKLLVKLEKILPSENIILCDSNENLQWTLPEGRKIMPLYEVLHTVSEKSMFLVASTMYATEIYAKLLSSRINRERIVVVSQDIFDDL